MSAAVRPELAIVIVNWNAEQYLRECLSSIVSETQNIGFEVVVVDNGSAHDRLDELIAAFSNVRLVRNGENIGFARANNLGFRATAAPYVLFLNPDTVVKGPALSRMMRALKERDDAGIVGCRLLNADLTLQTSCVQRYPRVLSQALSADALYSRFPRLPLWGMAPLFEPGSEPTPVEVVSGACLMVRRDVFERIGMFSEEYFMYAEDVDLCHKAAQANWRSYHVGDATVVHYGGGSSRQRVSSWAVVAQCGAKLQFLRKTRGVAYATLYRLAMTASAAVRCALLAAAASIESDRAGRNMRTRMAKWSAVLRWAVRPETTLRRLTMAQGE